MAIIFTFFIKKILQKASIVCLTLSCLVTTALSQSLPGYQLQNIKDTLPVPHIHGGIASQPKHLGRAVTELGLAEIIPWSFDKFLKKADYANISFKTVGNNLNPASWTWDDDNFQTNQFGHPFHGSQFYNTFRSNGYSFWQSAPAAAIGSYVWESTAENQPPAINDFINTTFGGIVLGEMTYRLSNKLINSNRSGFRRQASEVLGFIINPVNGINRILDGKWGKVTRQKDQDSSKISMDIDIGFRRFNSDNTNFIRNGKFGWFGHIKILYGDPYRDYDTPFSNIAINVEAGQDDSTKINLVSVYGSLAGWEIKSTEKLQHLAILSANYDYIHNAAFFYGGQSVKINLLSEYDLSEKTKINTAFSAGPILLAAIPDPYLYFPHGRNYDYGPGFSVGGSGQITIADRFYYNIGYRGGWTVTVNGQPSHYFLHTLSSEFSVKASKGFSLSAETGYFNLHGSYQKHPDVSRNYPYFKLSTRYSFDF